MLLGLTVLTRANDLALLVPIGFLLSGGPGREIGRGMARGVAIMTAVTLLMLVPWTVRNAHAFHQFVPITTEGGYATVGTYNNYAARRTDYPALWIPPLFYAPLIVRTASHSNEAEISDQLNTIAFRYVQEHPAYLLKVAFWNTLRQLNLTGVGFERSDRADLRLLRRAGRDQRLCVLAHRRPGAGGNAHRCRPTRALVILGAARGDLPGHSDVHQRDQIPRPG